MPGHDAEAGNGSPPGFPEPRHRAGAGRGADRLLDAAAVRDLLARLDGRWTKWAAARGLTAPSQVLMAFPIGQLARFCRRTGIEIYRSGNIE